jgi:DNA-binding CsgD family transcriptional regulator
MSNLAMLNEFLGLYVWKKNLNLEFVDLNHDCAIVFGFQNVDEALGKSDYEIPSGLAEFADVFRENDRSVLRREKKTTFLEIQPCAGNHWKILQVVKQPYYENNTLAGILGYCMDITNSYLRLDMFITGNEKNIFHHQQSISSNDTSLLTLRETECLFFLLRRCSAKETANILNLSYRTVEHHIEVIKSKFLCKSKAELIHVAKTLGYSNIFPSSIFKRQLSIIIE